MLVCNSNDLPDLPPSVDLNTPKVLKALVSARAILGELKGRATTIPNPDILIDTLTLQEARASSEIESIVTTQDDLFQAASSDRLSGPAKEVAHYREALKLGFDELRENGGISNNTQIRMFRQILNRSDGFRVTPGTDLKSSSTGEVVYTPPQDANVIQARMNALEHFINDDNTGDLDPLVRMALIHHQFESIHPFPDGNGRIGRILNLLYLVRADLLETPILYLSRHINQTKREYYRLLQEVRASSYSQEGWEKWVLYMLEAVARTATTTLTLVDDIRGQMQRVKRRMREELDNVYSQDLLNNLFRYPYTRTSLVMRDVRVSQPTATKYLNLLTEHGFVARLKIGRHVYYINFDLVQLFADHASENPNPH